MSLCQLQPPELRLQGRAQGRLSLCPELRLRKALPVRRLRLLRPQAVKHTGARTAACMCVLPSRFRARGSLFLRACSGCLGQAQSSWGKLGVN
jgi:hypothetical protein